MNRYNLLIFFLFITSALISKDYYWVGDSGQWSDITHWMTTSGGNIQHSSVPSIEDNVYFDENSFTTTGQTIQINIGHVFCKDFIWKSVAHIPELAGANSINLNINGSLGLSPDLVFNYDGAIILGGSGTKNFIQTSGHEISRLTINSSSGGLWVLNDDLKLTNEFIMLDGHFATNGNDILANSIEFLSQNQSRINLDNSEINIFGEGSESSPNFFVNTDQVEWSGKGLILNLSGGQNFFKSLGSNVVELKKMAFSLKSSNNGLNFSQNASIAFSPVKVDQLIVAHKTSLGGGLNIGIAKLMAGGNYRFSHYIETIIDTLVAEGSCTIPIRMASTSGTQPAKIFANSDVQAKYVSIRNIEIKGDYLYVAEEAIDLGGNNGWNIKERDLNTLYWVGGDGNWDDPMHWASVSGGPGGSCIPNAFQDVIFDHNSFDREGQAVRINIPNAKCKNMTWNNVLDQSGIIGPIFNAIQVSGSLTLAKNMSMLFEGDWIFNGRNDHTISSNGQIFQNNINFQSIGTWTLLDDLIVKERINFLKGTLNTNDQYVELEYFSSTSTDFRKLILGNSEIVLRTNVSGSAYWLVYTNQYFLEAGDSKILYPAKSGLFVHTRAGTVEETETIEYNYLEGASTINNHQTRKVYIDHGKLLYFASIFSNHHFGTLELTPGFKYTLFGGPSDALELDNLIAKGTCAKMIRLETNLQGQHYTIKANKNQEVHYVSTEDLHVEQSMIQANESIDLGNNSGWNFNLLSGRTLYWVGGTGNWDDRSHWSLISDGPGGECIPTPVDHVIIDEKSFTSMNGSIAYDSIPIAQFKTLTTAESLGTHSISLPYAYCHGSIDNLGQMQLIFSNLIFRDREINNTIHLGNHKISNLYLLGLGSWNLQDNLEVTYFYHYVGGFKTNSYNLKFKNYITLTDFDANAVFDADTSNIIVTGNALNSTIGSFSIRNKFHQFFGDQSTIYFTHEEPSLLSRGDQKFNNIHFSSQTGLSTIHNQDPKQEGYHLQINKAIINNSADLLGINTFDSLFFSPGQAYRMESQVIQTINNLWNIRGNNCAQIKLSSTIPGSKAFVMKEKGEVLGDFIQMRDIAASGGAQFIAGNNSSDISNSNEGWDFTRNEINLEEGYLGKDLVICKSTSLYLNANNEIGAQKYAWSDGSEQTFLEIDSPGVYWVKASFDIGCDLFDTIRVQPAPEFNLDLGPDTLICEGEFIHLDGSIPLDGVKYLWQDSSTLSEFKAEVTGLYSVIATTDACNESDSIFLEVTPKPELELIGPPPLCEDQTFMLSTQVSDASYLWSTGLTDSVIEIVQDGKYSVVVTKGGCTLMDSVEISFVKFPEVELGESIIACAADTIKITVPLGDAGSITWSDSSHTNTFEILANQDQSVWVRMANDACTSYDTVDIIVKPKPVIELGEDQYFCPGEEIVLEVIHNGQSLIWEDLSEHSTRIIDTSGVYTAMSVLNGCAQLDTLEAFFHPTPKFELGPDTLLCPEQSFRLRIPFDFESYEWNDGSSINHILVDKPGLYWVVANNGLCNHADSIFINEKECVQHSLYIPNAFSPNQDASNDYFKVFFNNNVIIQNFNLQIYSRWGNRVFESDNPDQGWNGFFLGKPQVPGVYAVRISYDYTDDYDSGSKTIVEDVTLVR